MTNVCWKWPKRIADVLSLPEATASDRKSKHSKLVIIALKLFPRSPMQNAIHEEWVRILNLGLQID